MQACHRSRKNHINKLTTREAVLVRDEEMAETVFDHFDAIIGSRGQQLNNIDFDALNLPSLQNVILCHYWLQGSTAKLRRYGRPSMTCPRTRLRSRMDLQDSSTARPGLSPNMTSRGPSVHCGQWMVAASTWSTKPTWFCCARRMRSRPWGTFGQSA